VLEVPACPVTGEPAMRLVQYVNAGFLADIWQIVFKTNARPSFGGVTRFGLWESPSGLLFFDPPIEGDREFYVQLYRRLDLQRYVTVYRHRREFALAAKWIGAAERVLDVGCGFGQFQDAIPRAHYVGLDPNFGETSPESVVCAETIEQHLVANQGSYDAVCAFQVIEHVARPRDFFSLLIAAARPNGRVILGVPHVPSAFTRLPNYMINAPPHHLTWWTCDALRTLAECCGLVVETVERVPWGRHDSLLYWMERCSFIKCRKTYFEHRWSWHVASAISFGAGLLANTVFGCPKETRDEGAGLLLVARKSAA
jgi:SAM-dependent methyltransferase